jgi:MoaA/NifB/PqqE/SkfB family radical SAM enzyme
MNKQEFKKCRQNNIGVLFKVTSQCNDNCKFCIERKFMRKNRKNLSLKEIRNNFEYLKDNFRVDYVVITGGEPTLHPDFFKIIDYFYKKGIEFRIITNLLNFSNEKFTKKAMPYFSSAKELDFSGKENKIIGSINDLPLNAAAAKRIAGLENVLKRGFPLMLIVVIYKDNLESLPELISYLSNLFKKHRYAKPMNMELRMIYIEGTLKSLLEASLPTDFPKIKHSVQKAIKTADSLGITLTLWNFPLCYLDNVPRFKDESIRERKQRKLLKVNKDFQLKNIQMRDFEEYFEKDKSCSGCKLNDYCSGIDGAYITKYHFPHLKSVL